MKCAECDVEVFVAGVLVACKSDLVQRREVSEKRGRELAASKDLHYFETSAVRTHSLYHAIFKMTVLACHLLSPHRKTTSVWRSHSYT